MNRAAPSSNAPGAARTTPVNGDPRGAPSAWSAARDLQDLGEVLWRPVVTFRRRRHRPTFLTAWIVASALTVVLSWFTLSISLRASAHLMEGVEDAALRESVETQLHAMKWVALAVAPVSLLARWIVVALLFWAMGTFLAPGVTFRRALSVTAYAGLPALLGLGLDLGVAWFTGPEFSPDLVPQPPRSTSSVLALFPALPASAAGAALARQVTVFSLWTAALWTIGLRETVPTGWVRAGILAALVTVGTWAAGTATELVQASLAGTAVLP